MDNSDILSEIIKHLHISSLLNFYQTNKFNKELSLKFIKNINEDQFIDKFKVLNESYEIYIPINTLKYDNISKISGFNIRYKNKNKSLCARYPKDHVCVFLLKYITRIKVTNYKSTEDAYIQLNNILLILFNYIPNCKCSVEGGNLLLPIYKLRHKSTTLMINKFQYDKHCLDYIANHTTGKSKRSRVHRNNNKINDINYVLNNSGSIVVTYDNFYIFFLTYIRYIK